MNRTDIINRIIASRAYSSYLEIGVCDVERNFAHIACEKKVSVDPAPTVVEGVDHVCTSDQFFENNRDKFDLIFLDGLHLEHQVDADIRNALASLRDGGVIVIHDALPPSEWHQRELDRYQAGEPWNGTVWKSILKSFSQSPHRCYIIDCDWGIAVIDAAHRNDRAPETLVPPLAYAKDFPRLAKWVTSSEDFLRMHPAPADHQSAPTQRQDLIRRFNRLYYHGADGERLFETTSWLGVPILKCPTDTWVYQEILFKTRPQVIVETGVMYGGSSFYLASLLDLMGSGEILACDIDLGNVYPQVRQHPRIRLLKGNSTDRTIVAEMRQRCMGKRTMVVLDSDHSEKHVLEELRLYSPLVTPGCYLICEDTNVNGHPVREEFGPGPYEAVQKFLKEQSGWQVDAHCERLLITFNPSGYLLRLAPEL